MHPRLLQACLNGNRSRAEHPAVPQTAAEIALAARLAVDRGADALHVHPRDAQGLETLDAAHVADCLNAIRRDVSGVPVGVSTGTWIAPGGSARLAAIQAWDVLPDYASVNLCEPDAPEIMRLLTSLGIGIEAGVWTADDAKRFVALDNAGDSLRVLIEMTGDDAEAALAECREIGTILDRDGPDLPRLLHGENGSAWALVDEACRLGQSTRIGLEDVLVLPDGRTAPDNAALVAEVVRRVQAAGT